MCYLRQPYEILLKMQFILLHKKITKNAQNQRSDVSNELKHFKSIKFPSLFIVLLHTN